MGRILRVEAHRRALSFIAFDGAGSSYFEYRPITEIRVRFATEIEASKLIVETCVLVTESAANVPFYIHKTEHVLN